MKHTDIISDFMGGRNNKNSYGNFGLSALSPILRSPNFTDAFVDMSTALGMHRIDAKMQLHMWIYGFFPEYKFRQENANSKNIPECDYVYIWECNRKRKPVRYHEGIKRGRWDDDEVEKLIECIENGMSYKEMAIELDRDYKSVNHKVASLNLK